MTELLVKMTDINTILPYEKNAKKHPVNQVEQIAQSILEYGFNVPILIDKANVIVCGVGRYLAAIKLNLSMVPTVILDGLTDEQIQKFRLADNKVAESKWDEVLLIEDMQSMKELGYSVLDIPGFSEADIDKLLKGGQDDKDHGDPNRVPDKKSGHGIKTGDLFSLGDHRLLCGDSTSPGDVARLMGGGAV